MIVLEVTHFFALCVRAVRGGQVYLYERELDLFSEHRKRGGAIAGDSTQLFKPSA